MDHKTDTDKGRKALEAYLKDCDDHAIVPDVGGAFHYAFMAGRASLAASAGSDGVASLSAAESVPAAVPVAVIEEVMKLVRILEGQAFTAATQYARDDDFNGDRSSDKCDEIKKEMRAKLYAALTAAPTLTQGADIAAGAVYAELPEFSVYAKDSYTEEETRGFDEADLRDFADRTHAIRIASHGQAPAQPDAPLPLLVRDIAAELGITAPQACKSLFAAGCGETSVNMAVTPRMARALRAMHPTPSPQAAQQAPAGAVSAHRVLRKKQDGEWVCDGRYWTDGAPSAELVNSIARSPDFWRIECAYTAAPAAPSTPASFQSRVQPWLLQCFGAEIAADRVERNHRFLEESLELVQALGCTASEAHQLVDYVYGRPLGEPAQEVGGVMVTLAALCLASGLDMYGAGEAELARIWTMVEKIRAKQAAKPKHSPLPASPTIEGESNG